MGISHQKSLTFSCADIRERGGLISQVKPDTCEDAGLFDGLLDAPARLLDIQVRVKFSVGSSAILAEGEIDGKWKLECSRCLDNFTSTFAGSFDETYPETVESIDLADAVRQTVLLSVQVKPLCLADCKGLCPKCGMNLNRGHCNCNVAGAGVKPFAVLKKIERCQKGVLQNEGGCGGVSRFNRRLNISIRNSNSG